MGWRVRTTRFVRAAAAKPASSLVAVVAWAAYAAYQIWIVAAGPIGYWNDTIAYVSVAHAPFPSRQLLAGARPLLVPVLWKLTGTPLSFAVVQTLIGIAAWTALAGTVAQLCRPGWQSVLGGSSVLAFASCWQVTEWNWNVLSESLALSAIALICASSLWLARRLTAPRASVLVASCALILADRDQAIWVVGPAALCVAAWGALGWAAARIRRRSAPSASGRMILVAVTLLAMALGAEVAAASSHRNVVNMKDVFVVRVFPFPGRVLWFAHHGMPEARLVDATARATPAVPGEAKVVGLDFGEPEWRPLEGWFGSRSESAYTEFLVTHPGYDLTAPFARPALTYNNAGGNLAAYGSLQAPARGGASNHALPLLPVLMFPSWKVVLAMAGIAGVLLILRSRWRCRVVAVLGFLIVSGLWSMLTAWHGDGMEIARHTLEGNIQIRAGVLVLAVIAVLGERGSPRVGATSGDEGAGGP